MDITASISNVFIYFSAIQIYDLSYIHIVLNENLLYKVLAVNLVFFIGLDYYRVSY